MQVLVILNDPPYGTERCYQGLRLADALLQIEEELELSVFLVSDAVLCAKKGQQTPNGFYNIERMLRHILRKGTLSVCKTCIEARGLKPEDLIESVRVTTMGALAQLTLEAEKVLIF